MLWPLFHYLLWNNATDGRLERRQWEAYAAVNQKYADLVVKHYRDGDISKQRMITYGLGDDDQYTLTGPTAMQSGCMITTCFWFLEWSASNYPKQGLVYSSMHLSRVPKFFDVCQVRELGGRKRKAKHGPYRQWHDN